MVYRKGETTKKMKLREWPHHVRLEIPDNGLGQRLNAMHDYCRDRGISYQTVGDLQRGQRDAMIWCFKAPDDAAGFREVFNEPDAGSIDKGTIRAS